VLLTMALPFISRDGYDDFWRTLQLWQLRIHTGHYSHPTWRAFRRHLRHPLIHIPRRISHFLRMDWMLFVHCMFISCLERALRICLLTITSSYSLYSPNIFYWPGWICDYCSEWTTGEQRGNDHRIPASLPIFGIPNFWFDDHSCRSHHHFLHRSEVRVLNYYIFFHMNV
jgi:hypothetical protein